MAQTASLARKRMPKWKRDARRSLRLVAAEGATEKSAQAISDSFSIPFALVLGATAFQVGVLAAVPRLIAALGQGFAPRAIKHMYSYRRVIYLSSLASACAFGAIGAVPWLPEASRVWALITLVVLGVTLLEFPAPALGCWVSEQVPVTRRGQYMAARHGLAAVATIMVLVLGGPFLDALAGRVVLGMVAVFGVASALQALSSALLFRIGERVVTGVTITQPSFSRLLWTLRRTNLGKFLIYSSLLHFGVFLAGPFFAPYQLKVLGFSYSGLLLPSVVMTVFTLVGVQIAGRMADRFGNLNLLRASAVALPVLPIAWVWITGPQHVALINILSGLAWGAFNLCSVNFVYELSKDEDRASNIAFLFLINGVSLFLGAMTGAVLFSHLPAIGGSQYLTIFILSGSARAVAAVTVLPLVKEVRQRRCATRVNQKRRLFAQSRHGALRDTAGATVPLLVEEKLFLDSRREMDTP